MIKLIQVMNSKCEYKDKSRSQIIVKSGYLFILTNFLLAALNIVIGFFSNSIAIISDAFHSLIDSVSGVLVIVGEKLANSHKFNSHRVKIERGTTILIALFIIGVGIHIIIESIEKLLEPNSVDYSFYTILILIISIFVKYTLAIYLKKTGKKIKSNVLLASGTETLNDTWISIAVLFSAVIYLIWGVDIESYVSIVIALVIIKVGLEFIFPKISHHHHHHLESDSGHAHSI